MDPRFTVIKWGGPIKSNEQVLYLPHYIYRRIYSEIGTSVDFIIGSFHIKVAIDNLKSLMNDDKVTNQNTVYVSGEILEQLKIPPGTSLVLKYEQEKGITLGPLVGLLTVKFSDTEKPYGKQTKSLYALFKRAPKANCFTYAFSPEDIDWKSGTINGYVPIGEIVNTVEMHFDEGEDEIAPAHEVNNLTYNKLGAITESDAETSADKVTIKENGVGVETEMVTEPDTEIDNETDAETDTEADTETDNIYWIQLSLPFPDIIYNRIPSRYWEDQEDYKLLIDFFQNHMGIPVFNPGFLDKWEIHEKLSCHPEAKFYLPPTTLITEGATDITNFMEYYQDVFLKPSSGSLGRRIIRLSKTGNTFSYRFRNSQGEIREGDCEGVDVLLHGLRMVMGERQYIIQKAIPLALYEGQEFDVRLLMQKDRLGNWRRTKTYVRLTQPGSLTANLSTGATARSIIDVLKTVFDEDFFEPGGISENIKTAANVIAKSIEACFPGVWGELGLDFGLDINGGVWLIEANAKPFKATYSSSGLTQRIEHSFLRPLEYAKLLTGFYPHSI